MHLRWTDFREDSRASVPRLMDIVQECRAARVGTLMRGRVILRHPLPRHAPGEAGTRYPSHLSISISTFLPGGAALRPTLRRLSSLKNLLLLTH